MATLLKEEKATSPDKGVVVAQHAHVEDKYNDVLDMDKSGLAEGHEVLEKELTLWQNLKLYRRAVLWAVVMSSSLIMEGFDKALIGNLWAQPAFSKRYGVYVEKTQRYSVQAGWQTGITQASTVGSFLGLFIGGWAVDRLGYRKTMMSSMILMIPFVLVVTLAPNKIALLIGQFLCGLPWGVFAALAPSYSSEICPIGLRGYLTTYVNLCWVMGQFIASGTMLGVLTLPGEWPYRLPFSLQLVWPLILIPLYWFCPESPWWYVRKDRLEDAKRSVMRLSASSMHNDADAAVAAMVRTNHLELEQSKGAQPRWIDCFRGTDLRRTEISALAWASQVIAGGSYVIGFATFFMLQAGLPTQDAFKLGLGVSGCAFVGTVLSWTMLHRFGRRQIYIVGLTVLCGIHFIIAGLSFPSAGGKGAARWAMCALIMIWVMIYDFTVGPVAYAIVGETSSTRLRAKTVALSRNTYYIVVVINNVIAPMMLNSTSWNIGAKANFVYGPLAGIMAVWSYFRLPEMKGRSYYELDILFEQRVSARYFSRTIVETNTEGVSVTRRA